MYGAPVSVSVSTPKVQQVATSSSAKPAVPEKQPNSLKEFVKRSFAQCSNDSERQHVSKELNVLIEKVTAGGRLAVHRWDLEPSPLPSVTPKTVSSEDNAAIAGKKRKSRWDDTGDAVPSVYGPSLSVDTSSSSVANGNVPLSARSMSSNGFPNTPEEMQMRMKRASRFQEDTKQAEMDLKGNAASKKAKKRKGNNGFAAQTDVSNGGSGGGLSEAEMESLKIIGTCQKLEKDYFRLTSPPLPHQVRPDSVLRKAIQLIKQKWEGDEVDYVYMCSQLKSIRQDLTVQHIKSGTWVCLLVVGIGRVLIVSCV